MNVARYWERQAEQFDALYEQGEGLSHRWNRLVRRAIFDRVRLTAEEFKGWKDFTVLDVGSGSGRNSVYFVQQGARKVIGLDFSEPMIKLARDFSRKHGAVEKTEFQYGDFMTMPLNERYDAVVALGFFDYVKEPAKALRRMAAVADRKVIASFPSPSLVRAPLRKLRYALKGCPVYFYTRRRLEELAREAGLTNVRIAPLGRAGYMLVAEMEGAK